MIKTIEDITFLETVIVSEKDHFELIKEYWGKDAFSIMFGDHPYIPNSLAYNIYNDELEEGVHLGILTEIYDEKGNLISYVIYRNIA